MKKASEESELRSSKEREDGERGPYIEMDLGLGVSEHQLKERRERKTRIRKGIVAAPRMKLRAGISRGKAPGVREACWRSCSEEKVSCQHRSLRPYEIHHSTTYC